MIDEVNILIVESSDLEISQIQVNNIGQSYFHILSSRRSTNQITSIELDDLSFEGDRTGVFSFGRETTTSITNLVLNEIDFTDNVLFFNSEGSITIENCDTRDASFSQNSSFFQLSSRSEMTINELSMDRIDINSLFSNFQADENSELTIEQF